MSKYYIGYEKDGEVKPILTAFNKNYTKVGDSIIDVVNFTTEFKDKNELINHLSDLKCINDTNIDLFYVLSKGNKDNREYKHIKYGDNIKYEKYKEFFNIEYLTRYIMRNKFDEEFINELIAFFIKDKDFIYNQIESNLYFTNEISSHADITNEMLVGSFINNASKINYSNLRPFFVNLARLYRESRHANSIGIENYKLDNDKIDMDKLISVIVKSYTTKAVNNKRRIDKKNLFNLGIFLSDYNEYIEKYYSNLDEENINNTNIEKGATKEVDPDTYMFLEEDDYIREGLARNKWEARRLMKKYDDKRD